MRIAILHYTAPPVIGGVERIVAEQAQALAKNGHHVTVVCGNEDAVIDGKGIAVRTLSALRAGVMRSGSNGSASDRSADASSVHGPGDASSPAPFGHMTLLTEASQILANYRDQNAPNPFLKLDQPILKHKGHLPHWQQPYTACTITWRLADAIPQSLIDQLEIERSAWLKAHPHPWTANNEIEYAARFEEKVEEWLDQGMGACVLKDEKVRAAVTETLLHRHGLDYELVCFAVMPNHVHVLVRLLKEPIMPEVVQAWKSVSSKKINALLKTDGRVWEPDYFDRLIRDQDHWGNAYSYILRNPQAARLETAQAVVWTGCESSAVWATGWGRGVPRPVDRRGVGAPARFASENGGALPPSQPLGILPTLLADHDAIIVHNLFSMPFNLPATRMLRQLAVEWNKVHWINWVHDIAAVNPAYAHLPWDDADHAMLKQPAPNCTNVAVSALRCREYLGLLRLPESACRMIPNGVDAAKILGLTLRIGALVTAERLWDRDYVLVHPARVLRRKNIEFGLRVAHALVQMGLDVAYLVTGAPDPHNADGLAYGAELDSLAAELGLEGSAYFLGKAGELGDDDMRGLYAVSDALVFPSRTEGFGLPIVEAALHGLPVFCSDIPAHREVGQNVAQFFDLAEETPEEVANRIAENTNVTQRYVRRATLAASLDWSAIVRDHLEPLLAEG